MKRLSIFGYLFCFTAGSLLATSMTGCGGGESKEKVSNNSSAASDLDSAAKVTAADSTTSTVSTSAPQDATGDKQQVAAKPELKGVWYGESAFDVDAFNAKLNQLDPQQAAQLQQMVSTFSTIVMAAEFRADSVMELDMMIMSPDGQQLRDRSVGTWAVVEQTETGLKISTQEYKNDEQQPTEKVYVYQFIDKDHFQFVPDSVSPDIREFSPRIIFQRVEQPLEDPTVAEETGKADTVVR